MDSKSEVGKKSNQKLIIGLILGILVGVLIAFYFLDYLPITTPILVTILITTFIIFLIGFLTFTWNRERIIRKVFGEDIEFDTVLQEAQENIHTLTDTIADNLPNATSENRQQFKWIAPRVLNYLLWSNFRNWGLRVGIMIFAAIGGLLGTVLLYNQNELIKSQNELAEGTRRSSLVFLMSNIMDKVDEELKDTTINPNGSRKLTPQTIGRIPALSQSLKPYYYLKDGKLIDKPLSPERGQLLVNIMNSNFDSHTLKQLIRKTTFEKINLDDARMDSMNIYSSTMWESSLRNATFLGSNMNEVDLWGADMERATFWNAQVKYSDLRFSNLKGADFTDANLEHADLRSSKLWGTKFFGTNLTEVDFEGSQLPFANFREATGLTYHSLSKAETLYKCENIPEEIEKQLRELNPNLFRFPFKIMLDNIYTGD